MLTPAFRESISSLFEDEDGCNPIKTTGLESQMETSLFCI